MTYSTMKRSKLRREIKKLEEAAKASKKKAETATKKFEAIRKKYDKRLKKLNTAMTRRGIDEDALAEAKKALAHLEGMSKGEKKGVVTPKETPVAEVKKPKPTRQSTSGSRKKTTRTKPASPTASPTKKDDLTLIEGIGPRLAEILNEAGITSLAQLARRKPAGLRKILLSKGSAYQIHNPETWPTQAAQVRKNR